MFIKIDDDNDHKGQGEGIGVQEVMAVKGLRPADYGDESIARKGREITGLFQGEKTTGLHVPP